MNALRSLGPLSLALLFACGGAVEPSTEAAPAPPAAAASPSAPAAPAEPKAPTRPKVASNIPFSPDILVASRQPFHATCGSRNAPFSDDDAFTLQPVQRSPTGPIRSIAIGFHRTVMKGAPLTLVDGPGGPATFPTARQAHSPDAARGVELTVFGADKDVQPSPLAEAVVTMIDVPAKDGEPVTARVELRFTDGGVLDATFSGPLVSYAGACQ